MNKLLLPVLCGALLLPSAFGQVDSVVVFNEIHYNPASAAEDLEYIELFNQNSVNVELSGWKLEGVGNYTFPKGATILGRSFVVIAKNPEALKAKTGVTEVFGPYTANLGNDGERLILWNHNRRIMDDLRFGDSYPWPAGPDGSGASLAKIRQFTESGNPERWAASRAFNGTPGAANDASAGAPSLAFSELTPASAKAEDVWIELRNFGAEPVNLAGLVLRNGVGAPYALKEGTVAAGAYLTVSGKDLGFPVAKGDRLFLLNSAGAGQFLDAAIWQDHARARPANQPTGRFLVPSEPTPGTENRFVFQTNVVVNEIMYHHRPNYRDDAVVDSRYSENPEEWIELTNRGAISVDLTGWQIRGGVEFDFAKGTSIPPGGYLVLSNDAAALRKKYPGISIVGDFRGQLNNSHDLIELQDPNGNPADSVHYYDDAPWAKDADGGGSSLELRNPNMDNSGPEAWKASDESGKSEWRKFTYRAKAIRPTYTATVGNFHEIRLGLLEAGVCLIDNVSVIEEPTGAKTEMIKNPTFSSLSTGGSAVNWRFIGNHGTSRVASDDQGNAYLRLEATSPMNYLNNLCEGDLSKVVAVGAEYEVSFDAKWISGNPQLRAEIYYNKIAKLALLPMPEKHGTPGAKNGAWEENPGPTFANLLHSPAVPESTEDVTVSVQVADPDGLSGVVLFYNIAETSWTSVPMTASGDRFVGTIPKQDNKIVQFYVAAADSKNAASVYPAAGEKSGAFFRFSTKAANVLKQSMRLITRASDATALNKAIDILSNARKPCTVIMDEQDITYDCGIRLRGSMFSRNGGADSGVNIKFPAHQPFRGAQGTVTVRRRNPHELLVKHMANQAGNVPESYNDFVELRGYMSGQTGLARLEMTRFGPAFWDGMYQNGSAYPCFKMEGIRDFQSKGAGGVKNPQPVGWIVTYDFANLGDDKEQYRHVLRNTQALAEDDYSGLMQMCKAFSAPADKMREEMEKIIDLDQWARVQAVQTLCGIADVYPVENPHNFIIYQRPTDGLFISCPWDWDFVFSLPASAKIYDPQNSRKNLWKVLRLPGVSRLYEGHLLDLVDTYFTKEYVTPWFTHYGKAAAQNYASQINTLVSRATGVRKQLRAQIPFAITTNEGADFTVDTSKATIRGDAWINVRSLRWEEGGLVLTPRWVDDKTWEITIPLALGANNVTIQALDYHGGVGSESAPVGKDTLVITNTGAAEAATSANLTVSEIMYHPAAPSAAEIAAGFTDRDMFEYIEFANVGAKPVDLSDASFCRGLTVNAFPATPLAPGQVGLLVSNKAAFEKRYGAGLPVLGVYTGNLSNAGENLCLAGTSGIVLHEFAYQDKAPWPISADGEGYSLIQTNAKAKNDLSKAESWKASADKGGSPGKLEGSASPPPTGAFGEWLAKAFSEAERNDPAIGGALANPDFDPYNNFLEYALGGNPKTPDADLIKSTWRGGAFAWRYREPATITDLSYQFEVSDDLKSWRAIGANDVEANNGAANGGYREVTVTLKSAGKSRYVRLKVSKS